MLYPAVMAMLTASATSTGTGMDTEMGTAVRTPLTLTGLPVTASYTDSSAMHYHQQVRAKKPHNISLAHCERNKIKPGFVLTLQAYLTFSFFLATSKQTGTTMAQHTEARMHTGV